MVQNHSNRWSDNVRHEWCLRKGNSSLLSHRHIRRHFCRNECGMFLQYSISCLHPELGCWYSIYGKDCSSACELKRFTVVSITQRAKSAAALNKNFAAGQLGRMRQLSGEQTDPDKETPLPTSFPFFLLFPFIVKPSSYGKMSRKIKQTHVPEHMFFNYLYYISRTCVCQLILQKIRTKVCLFCHSMII